MLSRSVVVCKYCIVSYVDVSKCCYVKKKIVFCDEKIYKIHIFKPSSNVLFII